jgi:hypothetical protein
VSNMLGPSRFASEVKKHRSENGIPSIGDAYASCCRSIMYVIKNAHTAKDLRRSLLINVTRVVYSLLFTRTSKYMTQQKSQKMRHPEIERNVQRMHIVPIESP